MFGGMSVPAELDVWTRNDVQAVSANKIIVNVKTLFIFSFVLLIWFLFISSVC
jgi:cell division protein FtsB